MARGPRAWWGAAHSSRGVSIAARCRKPVALHAKLFPSELEYLPNVDFGWNVGAAEPHRLDEPSGGFVDVRHDLDRDLHPRREDDARHHRSQTRTGPAPSPHDDTA